MFIPSYLLWASSKYFRFVFMGGFLKRQFYGLYSALGKKKKKKLVGKIPLTMFAKS